MRKQPSILSVSFYALIMLLFPLFGALYFAIKIPEETSVFLRVVYVILGKMLLVIFILWVKSGYIMHKTLKYIKEAQEKKGGNERWQKQ